MLALDLIYNTFEINKLINIADTGLSKLLVTYLYFAILSTVYWVPDHVSMLHGTEHWDTALHRSISLCTVSTCSTGTLGLHRSMYLSTSVPVYIQGHQGSALHRRGICTGQPENWDTELYRSMYRGHQGTALHRYMYRATRALGHWTASVYVLDHQGTGTLQQSMYRATRALGHWTAPVYELGHQSTVTLHWTGLCTGPPENWDTTLHWSMYRATRELGHYTASVYVPGHQGTGTLHCTDLCTGPPENWDTVLHWSMYRATRALGHWTASVYVLDHQGTMTLYCTGISTGPPGHWDTELHRSMN